MLKSVSVILFFLFPVWGWSQVSVFLTATPTASWFHSRNSSPNNLNWTTLGQNYNFAGRHFHSSAVMNNRLWIMGGIASGKVMSDVLSSTDGLNWNLMTAKAGFGTRWGQASLVFNAGQGNNLWVIGGSDSKTFFNDVWQSSDGVNWNPVTSAAPFTARGRLSAAVFNNKIWVIGGTSQNGFLNDIWNSSDGKNWTQVIPKETFPARYSATLTVHHNLLWLIAGQGATGAMNDVWSSPDGVNWTNMNANPGFPARSSHTTVVHQGLLWVFGGHDIAVPAVYNDTWWSTNGSQWTQANSPTNYSPRWAHTSAVFNGQIWIINGADGPRDKPVDYSDIWGPGVSLTATPGLTSTPTFTSTVTVTSTNTVIATMSHTASTATPTVTLTSTSTATTTATHLIATATPTLTLTPTKICTATLTATATYTPVPKPSWVPIWHETPTPANTVVLSAFTVPHMAHSGKPVKLLLTLAFPARVQWIISSESGQPIYQIATQGQSGLNVLIWQGTNSFNQPAGDGIYSYVIEAQSGSTQTTTTGKIFIR